MAVTQSEMNKTVQFYRENNGVDIRHLLFDEQKVLTEAFMHGAEKAIQMLLDRAKQKEMEIVERVANVGRYSADD